MGQDVGIAMPVAMVRFVVVRIVPGAGPQEDDARRNVGRDARARKASPLSLKSSTTSPSEIRLGAASAGLINAGSRPATFPSMLSAPLSYWL